MSKAVWFISYKLVEGASAPDFLLASKRAHDEVLSKKKGFISWQALAGDDVWVDLVTWKTMEDAVGAESDDGDMANPAAQEFYSFIDYGSLKLQAFTIERSY